TYASVHRNVALLLGGLLLLIAGMVGGIAAALHTAANGDELLPLVFWVLGGFIGGFVLLVCFSLRRHRWTLTTTAVVIEERATLGFLGRSRRAEIAFADVAGLATVQNGPHDVIELATRQGQRFRLGPTSRKPADHTLQGAIRAIDHEGLTAFAAQVQATLLAAGVTPPPLLPGLGFWNRPSGLCLLVVLLLCSVALAVVAIWGLFGGSASGARGGQAAALLVMLPFGVGWMLRRAWLRRRSVLRAPR
nr:hypothetical protein [Planctomycetota bacterium]